VKVTDCHLLGCLIVGPSRESITNVIGQTQCAYGELRATYAKGWKFSCNFMFLFIATS